MANIHRARLGMVSNPTFSVDKKDGKVEMRQAIIEFFVNRLKEPSSWAAFAALLGFMGYNIEDELWQHIVTAGVGVFGLIGFIAKENTKPDLANYKPSKLEEIVVKKSKGAENGNYNK